MVSRSGSSLQPNAGSFAATRWTLVLTAARRRDASSQAAEAMAELCRLYWYPLYAYIRRRGQSMHDAEDLTQGFFTRLLAKDSLAQVDPCHGKFRAFLLASLKHFLANEWDRSQTQKRGGGQTVVSLDAAQAESRYNLEPAHHLTPEKLFERQWALTILERVLARLQAEYARTDGHAILFDGLKQFLTSERPSAYADVARELQTTEGAIKVAVHRLRRRYRQLLMEEIGQTVANPDEIKDEIQYLLSCL
jgi:RNA polymerase sigma-70 factor (ECF subfamily)